MSARTATSNMEEATSTMLNDLNFVFDIAVFVLKRDDKLQPTNQPTNHPTNHL